ncbi:hypothetical protein BS78_K311200 [Paspalum vaginatum]|uniref:Uncharacterized protein n=1 Tax=Paspalum vaginatum TaxID=158149 RepID=A0A9W7XDY6_9POAL|nr:hypothetical protein BS78_K311200 [Paspalum vaginatum]
MKYSPSTWSHDTMKHALSGFTNATNQAMINLAHRLCQGNQANTIAAAGPLGHAGRKPAPHAIEHKHRSKKRMTLILKLLMKAAAAVAAVTTATTTMVYTLKMTRPQRAPVVMKAKGPLA